MQKKINHKFSVRIVKNTIILQEIVFAQSVCQICAKRHKTSQHRCNICEVYGQICSHSILKCSNCGEDHKANDNTCVFKTNPEKRSYKYAQNLQKSQQQEQQQLSTNSFHVLIDNTQRY